MTAYPPTPPQTPETQPPLRLPGWRAILLACIVLVGIGVYVFRDNPKETMPQDAAGEENIGVHVQGEVLQLSAEQQKRLQLDTWTVKTVQNPVILESTGMIQAAQDRIFHITPLTAGRIVQDLVQVGDRVQAGQRLAILESQAVIELQARYIHELHQNEADIEQATTRLSLAHKTLNREQQLFQEGISPRKDLDMAENQYALAKATLAAEQEHARHIASESRAHLSTYGLGLPNAKSEVITTQSPIIAPKAGIITEKTIALGDVVNPQTVMYTCADLSQLWLDVTVYAPDLPKLQLGQALTFTSDSLPNTPVYATVQYLSAQPQTGSDTYIARAILQRPDKRLLPGMVGTASITLHAQANMLVIPEAALQRTGEMTFVFQELKPGHYQRQPVTLGPLGKNGYTVRSGLKTGDRVVTQGSFTLKALLMNATEPD